MSSYLVGTALIIEEFSDWLSTMPFIGYDLLSMSESEALLPLPLQRYICVGAAEKGTGILI